MNKIIKYIAGLNFWLGLGLIGLLAYDLPMIPKQETNNLELLNIQLYQQQKIMLFCCVLLFFSLLINLGLMLFYWNTMLHNRELNDRVSIIRLTLSDLAQKAEALVNANLLGITGSNSAFGIPIIPEEEEESIEIIKRGF